MITIFFPWPNAKLSPNARLHRQALAALKKQERDFARLVAMDAMKQCVEFEDEIPMSITFNAPDLRHRDVDNLLASLKAWIDGVADALQINDFQFNPITLRRGSVLKNGSVTIEIGETE